MAKYFSGITFYENKYKISIIDDNLNIIFLDNLDYDRLMDLLKRKSVTVLSVDAPLALYSKLNQQAVNENNKTVKIKKRSFDNVLISKNLLTYHDKFIVSINKMDSLLKLYNGITKLGFSVKSPGIADKSIIEAYADTSFAVLGLSFMDSCHQDDILKKKIEFLKYKGIRIKDYLKRNKKDTAIEVDVLCQAYTAYLYHSGDCTCFGSQEEGVLVLPSKNIPSMAKPALEQQGTIKPPNTAGKPNNIDLSSPANKPESGAAISKAKGAATTAEYCGAQYLYTNTDGIIRINELRPIKSYRPFSEIYEIGHIRQVQVIIGTTDGLRKVKANLILNQENSNSFRAADDEDKRKLDNFWGNHGDKRGYLIKFNRVEIVKA